MTQYELGQFIKFNILPKKLKQAEIAAQLEVTRQTLSRLLNGHTTLSDELANKLSKAYNADVQKLLDMQQSILAPKQDLTTKSVRSYTSKLWDISADDISSFFERKKIGRDLLPQFVRMLVRSQNISLTMCDFHAGDNSERKGWDGETIAEKASCNVPAGYSIWELGTSSDPRKKAETDYNKSLNKQAALPQEKRLRTTYIFVTPLNWDKSKEWAKGKAALGDYENVIALDASDLEQWLEGQPSVQAWLAEKLGINTNGISTLESFWDKWAGIAEPKIAPLIFQPAIDAAKVKIENWFKGNGNEVFSIQAGTREEVGAFLGAASILDEEFRDLLTNCVIVDETADLHRLAASSSNLIPIALDTASIRACTRTFIDRAIIVSRDVTFASQDEADLNIDLPESEGFEQSLKAMGFNRTERDQLVAQTNCSPTILRRSLVRLPEDRLPHWSKEISDHQLLIPAFLAGGWQKRKEDDIAFVGALAKVCGIEDYQDVERELIRLSQMDDSPVWLESDYRGVTSKLESLLVLGPYITEEILDEYLELCELLLSEYDPALDLDKDKRWAAAIYNKTRRSSGLLRVSVTNTLIILAVHGQAHLAAASSSNIQSKIDGLVSRLLRDGSNKNWLSQNGMLRIYAEASPISFIAAVKSELKKEGSVLDEMFLPADSNSFGSSPERTDLLWALEVLAWSKDHVVDACIALAELCRYPCNDNWMNKPLASLNDVLLYWRPHTCLNVLERKKLLQQLYNRYPDVAWKLATDIFSSGGMTSGTCKPKYRDWASGIKEDISNEEVWDYGSACRDILLSHTPYTTDKTKELIDLLDTFPEEDEEKLLHIFSCWKSNASKQDFIEVRELIRTRTRTRRSLIRQKSRQQAGQSYFDGEKLLTILKPRDVLEKNAWLFLQDYVDESLDELEENDEIDFKARDKRISKLRSKAIEEVWLQLGNDGLNSLISLCKSGYAIGMSLSKVKISQSDLFNFITQQFLDAQADIRSNASFVLMGVLRNLKLPPTKVFELSQQKAQHLGRPFDPAYFCTLMNFDSEVLLLVSGLAKEVQAQYWKKVTPHYFRDSDIEPNELIHQLLDVDRPLAAFSALRFDSQYIDSSTLIKLLRAVATADVKAEPNYQLDQYRICELIGDLQKRTDVSVEVLASIEFTYAPILADKFNKGGIPTLTKVLYSDPKQYIHLVAMCYLRRDRKDDFEDIGLPDNENQRKTLAETAHHILDGLKGVPGFDQEDLTKKIEIGNSWVGAVLKLAEQYDRSVVTKLKIGELLATGKVGSDGVWPCEHVRGILEYFQDEDISRGLQIAKQNSRGVTMRPRPDNGDKERDLAKTFIKGANVIAIESPFTANILRNLARRYEEEGERHDSDGRLERYRPE